MRKSLLALFASSLVLLVAAAAWAQPYYGPGSYQAVPWDIGSAAQLVDDGTNGDVTAGDGVYTATVNVATAGAYEWKAAVGDWSSSWPSTGNCWFITSADNQDVVLTFDTNSAGDGWAPDSYWPDADLSVGGSYTLVGELQSELGAAGDWDPASAATHMHDDGLNGDAAAGDGIYTFEGTLPAGTYQWKVAVNDNWSQQFGTDGPSVNAGTWSVTVNDPTEDWVFQLDTNTGRIYAYHNAPVPTKETTWSRIKTLY